jgi:modification methylase eco47II
MPETVISLNNFSDLVGVSRATVEAWVRSGKYQAHKDINGKTVFLLSDLSDVPEIKSMNSSKWDSEKKTEPFQEFTSAELFAGAGGLALGMEKAGFRHVLLNEFDHYACETLRHNRPGWNIIEGDIHDIDFTPYRNQIDFLSGGFPCQAFSYAGKRLGFEETRGTLFFELARAVKEIQPKVFMGENVKGLFEHDNGRTLQTIKNVISELGYTLVEPRILRAIQYDVPQKRERLILIAIRNDIAPFVKYNWPDVCTNIRTLRDAFYGGSLFPCDVPNSPGQSYPESKRKVMQLVPEGGDWRDLPSDVARDYMKGSYNLGGGKTGMARRLSMDEPSLTLTCAPAQKQTERCHPIETRPLTVREYARIQTFPDDWQFCGPLSAQYKQIGNAVPVNLSWAIGRSLIRLFNDIAKCGFIPLHDNYIHTMHNTILHGIFEGMVCEKESPYTKSRIKKGDKSNQ